MSQKIRRQQNGCLGPNIKVQFPFIQTIYFTSETPEMAVFVSAQKEFCA